MIPTTNDTTQLVIQRAENGVVITRTNPGDAPQIMVIEQGEDDEAETLANLCWAIIDLGWLGNGTRYSAKRCVVRVEPGDKYEPPVEGALL